jgi:hypothetical protein
MSIRLNDLYEQVHMLRSDVIPEQCSWALVEAAIQLAIDTDLLRDVTLFTLEENAFTFTPDLPNGRNVGGVFKVERYDPDLDRWVKLTGPCALRIEGEDVELLDTETPSAWGVLDGVINFSAPADDEYAMRATISWIPGRTPIPSELDFPRKAEKSLVAYAKHLVMAMAGTGQNGKASASFKRDYDTSLSILCAVAKDGEGVSRSLNDFLPYEV